jgi:hypothetical protein
LKITFGQISKTSDDFLMDACILSEIPLDEYLNAHQPRNQKKIQALPGTIQGS